jgi:hypothetical protein
MKEAQARVTESDPYKRLLNFYPGLNFEAEIAEKEELADFIRSACA